MTDYIEKNSVIELIDDAIRNCKWHVAECTINTDDRDLKTLREKVKAIPAADVAPVVHARWETPMALIQCSHCGFGMFPDGYYFDHGVCVHANESWFRPDYCPQCGARMDGEEE